jgi:hypothetical protein
MRLLLFIGLRGKLLVPMATTTGEAIFQPVQAVDETNDYKGEE